MTGCGGFIYSSQFRNLLELLDVKIFSVREWTWSRFVLYSFRCADSCRSVSNLTFFIKVCFPVCSCVWNLRCCYRSYFLWPAVTTCPLVFLTENLLKIYTNPMFVCTLKSSLLCIVCTQCLSSILILFALSGIFTNYNISFLISYSWPERYISLRGKCNQW